jgi:hypothetical protein
LHLFPPTQHQRAPGTTPLRARFEFPARERGSQEALQGGPERHFAGFNDPGTDRRKCPEGSTSTLKGGEPTAGCSRVPIPRINPPLACSRLKGRAEQEDSQSLVFVVLVCWKKRRCCPQPLVERRSKLRPEVGGGVGGSGRKGASLIDVTLGKRAWHALDEGRCWQA